ncbi:MAG: hypothetical protein KBB55_03585 [Candidatus Buchananbacteria bacterium]|nr:hypothetical protein [Candidatus Buchananbacteria bacterium]
MLTDREREYINNLPQEIAEKPVEIFQWEAKSLDIAQSVIDSVKFVDPGLTVFLRGSVPLKISGQKDIDLTCNDSVSSFDAHKAKLEPVFGKASKQNDSSVVWHFLQDGYEISFYIVDPEKSDQLARQTKLDSLFKSQPHLLKEYEDLKVSLAGVPYKVYLEDKFEFFNRIRGL